MLIYLTTLKLKTLSKDNTKDVKRHLEEDVCITHNRQRAMPSTCKAKIGNPMGYRTDEALQRTPDGNKYENTCSFASK